MSWVIKTLDGEERVFSCERYEVYHQPNVLVVRRKGDGMAMFVVPYSNLAYSELV